MSAHSSIWRAKHMPEVRFASSFPKSRNYHLFPILSSLKGILFVHEFMAFYRGMASHHCLHCSQVHYPCRSSSGYANRENIYSCSNTTLEGKKKEPWPTLLRRGCWQALKMVQCSERKSCDHSLKYVGIDNLHGRQMQVQCYSQNLLTQIIKPKCFTL